MEEKKENLKQNKMDWSPIISFYIKVTSWIVIPAILAFLLKNNLTGIKFILLIIFSFLITCFGIYKEVKNYQSSIEKKDGNK